LLPQAKATEPLTVSLWHLDIRFQFFFL